MIPASTDRPIERTRQPIGTCNDGATKLYSDLPTRETIISTTPNPAAVAPAIR